MYDIIGDIHGCAKTLRALLEKLGYREQDCVYRHPSRKAIFLGDFIDRGPHQAEVLNIVRPMIEDGNAQAVMGNHEFNAIAYYTPTGNTWRREHSERNRRQHRAFLDEFEDRPCAYGDMIEWFQTLPLWLDLDGIRVIHACWEPDLVERLSVSHEGPRLTEDLLHKATDREQWEFSAIEILLKGQEAELPLGIMFLDKDGISRHRIRVRWWESVGTYQDAYLGSEDVREQLPNAPLNSDFGKYPSYAPPVFVGHYWMQGEPAPLAPNVACLDYSVARGGKLVAYRWDGERQLRQENFVAMDCVDVMWGTEKTNA